MRPRIVYITNVRLPTYRAHGLQIMKMCEAFAGAGADVTLVAPRLCPVPDQEPFLYYRVRRTFSVHRVPILEILSVGRLPKQWLAYLQSASFTLCALAYCACRGFLSRNTVLYTRDYMTGFALALLGFRPVLELHDYRGERPKWRYQFLLRRARLIVTNSEGTSVALQRHYPRRARTTALPNGIDASFFDIPQSQAEARARFGIPAAAAVIAYAGRLETVGLEKGVSILLCAFARTRRAHPGALLAIAGGPDDLVEKYRVQARELDIPDAAVRFTGHLPYADMPLFLRAVDIAVIPFPAVKQLATTASPLKTLEFMAAGKTIVASDLPTLRGMLNEENALFFAPGDAGGLAERLMTALTQRDRMRQLGERARADAAAHAWSARARAILAELT
jgi:glycosyltransferase involved in cell wall biosynthesis